MSKIRQLKAKDLKRIREMIEYVDSSSPVMDYRYIPFPLNLVHNWLPLNFKFLSESYVAIEDRTIQGLIGLSRDGNHPKRWKINHLILSANALNTGKQLIQYVIHKYGGLGVENFVTVIDENNIEVIDLFKNGCGFRSCSKIEVWQKDTPEPVQIPDIVVNIRKAKKSDAVELQDLESQSLFPQFRISLQKNTQDFKFGLKTKIYDYFKRHNVQRLVLENPKRNSIEGYIFILTTDNQNFWADIVLSAPYQGYYGDLIDYVSNYVAFKNRSAKLNIYNRKYYQANEKLSSTLNSCGFALQNAYQVLVKDYWKPTSIGATKKSTIVIFPDITSPACNFNNH